MIKSRQDYLSMSWQEFEDFVIELFDDLYSDSGLKVRKTPYQNDGGKDGFASLIIAPLEDDALTLSLKLWVEVKKRTSSALDLDDIGGHLILAMDQSVNKLIFVTNSDFTDRARLFCRRIGWRLNTGVEFFDGDMLVQLDVERRQRIQSRSRTSTNNSGEARLTHLSGIPAPPIQVELRAGFARDLDLEPLLDSRDLTVDVGEVLYWVCVVEGRIQGPEQFVRFVIDTTVHSDVLAVPMSDTEFLLSQFNSSYRVVFAVWGLRGGKYAFEDLKIRVILPASVGDASLLFSTGALEVREPVLGVEVPASRQKLIGSIELSSKSAIEQCDVSCHIIEADAGAGKSFTIQVLRRSLLKLGFRELCLDGGLHPTIPDVVRTMLAYSFPFPVRELSGIKAEILKKWCVDGGIDAFAAEQISRQLYEYATGSNGTLTEREAAAVVGRLLTGMFRKKPFLLVFEDLHKVPASVLAFIRELIGFLQSRTQGAIVIVLTSRPYADTKDGYARKRWGEGLRDLFGDSRILLHQLSRLDALEAETLLHSSIKHLKHTEASSIIRQVGTSPFSLREAVLYLRDREVIKKQLGNGYFLADPDSLLLEIDSATLSDATRRRIEHFYAQADDSFRSLLVAAACLGDTFSTTHCRAILPTLGDADFWRAIEQCERSDILRPVLQAPMEGFPDYRFDHDLLRRAILRDATQGQLRRTAYKLLSHPNLISDARTRFGLAFLAGSSDECLAIAVSLYEHSSQRQEHQDALLYCLARLYLLQLSALVPQGSEYLRMYVESIDEALQHGNPPPLQIEETVTASRMVIVVLEALGQMASIGTMENELSSRLLTIGHINATLTGRAIESATLEYYDGLRLSGQNRHQEALSRFIKASEIRARERAVNDDWSVRNSIRISICQRHLGRMDRAMETLADALRHRRRADWLLLDEVVANLGAFYMYDNPAVARRYWARGERIASRRGNWNRHAHFLNDLAHVDIMENRLDDALRKISSAEAIAQAHGVTKELIRSGIFRGTAQIVLGNYDVAELVLSEAEQLAVGSGNLRRLWRIRSNLATLFEAMGRWEECFIEDWRSLAHMPVKEVTGQLCRATERRSRLLAASYNIAARVIRQPSRYAQLVEVIDKDLWHFGSTVAGRSENSSETMRAEFGGLLNLLKPIGSSAQRRFLITE